MARKELRKLKMVRIIVVKDLTIFYCIIHWRACAIFIFIPMSVHKSCLTNYRKKMFTLLERIKSDIS